MMIDRPGLAHFLRVRRESLQPEDVGLARGQRRRTSGLRREEVAALAHMSTDYYARLERQTGPQPSAQMIASIAQGLHLSLDERNHVFRLAGHNPPSSGSVSEHIGPGMLRIFDRLHDTPAEIVSELGETLRQTALGVALTGDQTAHAGLARSLAYRWFTVPASRELYAPEDHSFMTRMWVSGLRGVATMRGADSRAARIVEELHERSSEFRDVWALHEVGIKPHETKNFVHPELGPLALNCQSLMDPIQSQALLVYTAVPGSESYDKLLLLPATRSLSHSGDGQAHDSE